MRQMLVAALEKLPEIEVSETENGLLGLKDV